MAKETYIGGANNKSKHIPDIGYIGIPINGVGKSKKILKGYIGNAQNKSRLFWPAGSHWNPYSGKKLVFDIDYEPGNTYVRYRADIEETIRFSIWKTIFYNKGLYKNFINLLQSKIEDIVSYALSQLISTDNVVYINTSVSGSFRSITFLFYVGNSLATSIKINALSDTGAYPLFYYDTSNSQVEGTSRVCISYKLNEDGTVEKQTYAAQRALTNFLGNGIDENMYASNGIVVQKSLINTGVHFEDFNTGDIVANWNFTQSNYDTVEQLVGCRDLYLGNSSIDSSGLHLVYADLITVPSWLTRYANTIEIEFGTYSINTSAGNGSIVFFNGNKVVLSYYQSDGYWKFMDNYSEEESIGVNSSNFFENSKLKIHYDEDGFITLYKDNVKIYKTQVIKMTSSAKQGYSTQFCANISGTVKKLKFFNE